MNLQILQKDTDVVISGEKDIEDLEMSLRQRRKPVTQLVTELDAFPKVPETYVEQTATGAYGELVV